MLESDLQNAVPARLRPVVNITILTPPVDGLWIATALAEALLAIENVIRYPTAVDVIVGKTPSMGNCPPQISRWRPRVI